MTTATVALVTSAAHPELAEDDWPLRDALAAQGLTPLPMRWDDAAIEWARFAAVVIRSPWDYHHRVAEFDAWLDRLDSQGARVFNPLATLRWNSRKTYLRDLAAIGVPVVPTAWVARGEGVGLDEIMRRHGWRDAVVKPTVSASAFETWRTGPAPAEADTLRFARLSAERDLMVQPYLPSIESDGEVSAIFLGGRYSHAVLKRPRAGEFRVQHELGGTAEPARPPSGVVEQAARAVAAAPTACLYARVDGCVIDGELVLMELELIEPSLFFRHEPRAAVRFVAALREALKD